VISLPELIDNATYAKELIGGDQARPRKPIGGEMEMYQIAHAANEEKTEWIAAKAVSDYAGLDGVDKKEHKKDQPLAAAAAADFANWILSQDVMDYYLKPK